MDAVDIINKMNTVDAVSITKQKDLYTLDYNKIYKLNGIFVIRLTADEFADLNWIDWENIIINNININNISNAYYLHNIISNKKQFFKKLI